jgi:hypothetical protein
MGSYLEFTSAMIAPILQHFQIRLVTAWPEPDDFHPIISLIGGWYNG